MKKYFFIVIALIIIFINFPANSEPLPTVNFDGEVLKYNQRFPPGTETTSYSTNFDRNLGKTKDEIYKSYNDKYPQNYSFKPKIETIIIPNYELYIIVGEAAKAVYILKDNICIGYYIACSIPMLHYHTDLRNDNNYKKIILFPTTNNIPENIDTFPQMDFLVYEKELEENFSEKYILVKSNNKSYGKEYILSYAFYPKELEEELESRLLEYINKKIFFINYG